MIVTYKSKVRILKMLKIKHIALGVSVAVMPGLGVACCDDRDEELALCRTLGTAIAIGEAEGRTYEKISDALMRELDLTHLEYAMILQRCNELMRQHTA